MAGYRADFRGVLGHEFVGVVVDAPGAEEWVGQRVVGEINVGCGLCALCRRGLGKHCRRRRTVGIVDKDGAFAEYLALSAANLHRVPATLPNERAVFVEPLAAAIQVLEQISIRPSDAVAIVGDGRLGLLIAQVVAQIGCRLTLLGRHDEHLSFFTGTGVDTVTVNRSVGRDRYLDGGFDIVVEATGAESGFLTARSLVRPGGTIVLKSTFAGPTTALDISSLVVDEVQVIGSRCGPFEPAIRMLNQGRVEVDQMIHRRFSLDDGVQALEYAARRGVLKVLISP
jgi:alcohol dehydrogenase